MGNSMPVKKRKQKKNKSDSGNFLADVFGEFAGSFIGEVLFQIVLFIPRMIFRICRYIFD